MERNRQMLVVKYLLKHCTKMYDTYKKMSDVFVEPDLNFGCALWKNDPFLPVWRHGLFHIFNWDVHSKADEDGYSVYEFPPQFTIVVFGISFTWWLTPPKSRTHCGEYWESLEDCLYLYKGDIRRYYMDASVIGHIYSNDEYDGYYNIPCKPEYLKNPEYYYEAKSYYSSRYPDRKYI